MILLLCEVNYEIFIRGFAICLITLLQTHIDCWCSCFTFFRCSFFTLYFFI